MYTEFITFDLYSFGIFSFHIYRASVIQQLQILFLLFSSAISSARPATNKLIPIRWAIVRSSILPASFHRHYCYRKTSSHVKHVLYIQCTIYRLHIYIVDKTRTCGLGKTQQIILKYRIAYYTFTAADSSWNRFNFTSRALDNVQYVSLRELVDAFYQWNHCLKKKETEKQHKRNQ